MFDISIKSVSESGIRTLENKERQKRGRATYPSRLIDFGLLLEIGLYRSSFAVINNWRIWRGVRRRNLNLKHL